VEVTEMRKKNINKVWIVLLFSCYGALMIYLLFFRNRMATEGLSYWEQVNQNYNLTIWKTVGSFWDILARREYYMEKWGAINIYRAHAQTAVVNLVGNVVMFLPFGMFLPAIWKRLQRLWKVLPIGLLVILTVEITQLFTLRGKCDVDDVLLNMLGIGTGYMVWRIAKRCRSKRK
jgi:glycopeptide antibiotics resistance protein